MKWRWVLIMATLLLSLGSPALAGVIVTVDENGKGTLQNGPVVTPLPFVLGPDPGPGGLSPVLTYILPYAGTQGDVLLTDADFGGLRLDVIRFNGDGTLIFYSDNVDGFDALADTPAPPGSLYANNLSIPELGTEGNNGAFYTPTAGQPGFDPLFQPTYNFISDGPAHAVPEPASITLLLSGAGLAGFLGWRRQKQAAEVA